MVGFCFHVLGYDIDLARVSPHPSLFALVIGIDKYLSNGIPNLSGAVADADAISTFLQETLRVPTGQIKNLRNEEGTRLTIEVAIKDLGNNPVIKKDDPILIFYAGHGAEANAPTGWSSANGKIQMLLPHDFITSGSDDSKRGQGVLDMRLSHLLADLAAKKSDNIVRFPCFYHAWYLIRCTNRPSFSIAVTLDRARERTTMILLSLFVGSISQRLISSLKTSCMILSQMLGGVTLERDSKRQVCYHTCSLQPVSTGKKPEKKMGVAYLLQRC